MPTAVLSPHREWRPVRTSQGSQATSPLQRLLEVRDTSSFLPSELQQVAGFVHSRRDAQGFPSTSVFPALAFTASLGHAPTHEDAVRSPLLRLGSCPSLQGNVQSRDPHVGIPLDTFHPVTPVGLPPYLEGSSGSVALDSSYDPVRLHTSICFPFLTHSHVIVRTENMVVVSHINHQGRLRSRTLNRNVRQLLLWAQDKFLSLRAVYVPGVLNLAADFLSRQKLRSGEWMLNRRMVDQIWERFGTAEVDLFVSQESTQCPLWFSLSHPTSLGIDALVHPWPDMKLYAFPPVKLIPAVLRRVKMWTFPDVVLGVNLPPAEGC